MPKKEAYNRTQSKRKFLSIALVLAVLIGGVGIFMNMGSMIKTTVENVATKTLGVPVTVSSIDIKLTEKKITVSNLRIGNPKGFSKPHALTIGQIVIDADTISKEKLVFSNISTADTNIYLEVTESGTNLSSLSQNVKKGDKTKAKEATPVKVIIEKLALKNSKLHPAMTLIKGAEKTVNMPEIKLTGIGQKSGGVTAAEAISQVLEHVVQAGMEASLKAGLLEGLSDQILGEIGKNMAIPGLSAISGSKELKNVEDKVLSIFK